MGRALRAARGGIVSHILNRSNGRRPLFEHPGDYQAFERVLAEAQQRPPVPLLACCIMPNHGHLVLFPPEDDVLSRHVGWLTLTHAQRRHAYRHSTGSGHIYQARFKSFPVEADGHFLTVCRYVERNALRAGLVSRAEDWPWCSLGRRLGGEAEGQVLLGAWPVPRPQNWLEWVNEPQSPAEEAAVRRCVSRGQPYGRTAWVEEMVGKLGLETTMRPQGRPKKREEAGTLFDGIGS